MRAHLRSSAIEAAEIGKSFGETVALDGISFEVSAGELFGFIGPDGAGKTTLFRILTTLLVPDRGTAQVLGQDVVADLWALRARIGYMPGRFSLYPDLSVAENLDFFASVFGTTVEAEYAFIAPIYRQIEEFRDRRAAALSGGMKQKLALCCALVHRPEILLLDEPTTGVDAVSRSEFWDLLGELRRGGLTIVVSTPYMDEASRCDRIALIQKGRILDIDSPEGVRGRYPLPLFAVRGADRHRLVAALREYPHVHSAYPFGDVAHYTDRRRQVAADAITSDLTRFLAERRLDVEVAPISATVEDSFMYLMGREPGSSEWDGGRELRPGDNPPSPGSP